MDSQRDNEKPPVGLRDEKIWLEERLEEISAAVKRYEEAKMKVPLIWLGELSRHTTRIEEIKKGIQ